LRLPTLDELSLLTDAGYRFTELSRMSTLIQPPVRVLYSAESIATRVRELGALITRDYAGRSLVILPVLKGSFVFAADLIRCIDLPLRVEFLGVASYGSGTRSTGVVQITQDVTAPIAGEDIILVEDIVDTGLTIDYLLRQLHTRGPNSLKVCALLHKPSRAEVQVNIDYLGFTIDDEFVVGYGLDHAQAYRNLPHLSVLAAD
jgi:hypoxanthine phosphoribosyltransferase